MTAHVLGAGLAGLSAAVRLLAAGLPVELSEAAAQAGGRCRSYRDPQLGMVIDNGNHLVLSGNAAVGRYLKAIGASERLIGPLEAEFHFADLRDGARWTVRPNRGRLPWWVLVPGRRVPGTRVRDYLSLVALTRRHPGRRIDAVMPTRGALWERLIEPFLVAVLNTRAEEGSADLAGAVVRESLAMGSDACRPRIASPTLAAAFVEPAVERLTAGGAAPRLGRRLRRIEFAGDVVSALHFADGVVAVAPEEPVVLALPAWVAAELVPDLTVPDDHRAIVNAHFALAPPAGATAMIGVVGGTAEWVFAFADRFSVTVSAADHLLEEDAATLAARIWGEVARLHGLSDPLPPYRIVREKRATFAATPAQAARRPSARTLWRNLFLAGDWTDTGLPSTIEGALRSGETAAALAAALRRN
ncbi:hydroxysqualene dehydroxylase HpnE [Roseomonas elaeocarpi]|uniref:Hydroxysqualene dehydroxylase HpnE n=1 Tax=Roseomonas elaeocarpi TaxID=907779 RepID=A0ABV6JR99_9PROT